ncbi:hypothetical protein EIP91_000933 [Steccherinum ochraceum]|uniref:F-box domain-containing protein n=1 Tax=Steccherinum ochraceum TaxID=92696 RepID=A0A4V2MWN1_9APHY|nr:hypothetical protein EIP91_000933 [Steccherinum ochraceum]
MYSFFTHMDKSTISACSLLSRHWAAPSQTALFKTMVVKLDQRTLPSLCEFLTSKTSLVIATYVKIFTIDGSKNSPQNVAWPIMVTTSVADLHPLLVALPSLQSLRLVSLHIVRLAPSPLEPIGDLKELWLERIWLEGHLRTEGDAQAAQSSASELFNLFRKVKTCVCRLVGLVEWARRLEVQGLACSREVVKPAGGLSFEELVYLRSLGQDAASFDCFIDACRSGTLRRLSLQDRVSRTNKILEASKLITHLHLNPWSHPPENSARFDLRPCKRLTHVTIALELDLRYRTTWRDQVFLIVDSIRQLPKGLVELIVDLTYHGTAFQIFSNMTTYSSWETVDAHLNSIRSFMNAEFILRVAATKENDDERFEEEKKFLMDGLYRLHKANKLQIRMEIGRLSQKPLEVVASMVTSSFVD